jgi:hypothetical protein
MNQTAIRRGLALAILAAMPLCCASAQVDIDGVKLDEAIVLRGHPLQLNGAGVRYKTVLKVYAAGLYLSAKAYTPEEAAAAPGAKRIAITMLRDVNADELGRLFTRGVEDNSPRNAMAQLIPGLVRMGQVFSAQKELKAGDTIHLDWVPDIGTFITIQGVTQQEPIREQAFFQALMRIWIGPNPADMNLKNALLGKR